MYNINMFWFNGLTALTFVCFGTIFGIGLFLKANRIDAKLLKIMALNIFFATWCYMGYVADFLSLLFRQKNFINLNGEIGIISGIWLAIAIILAMHVGSELNFPKYRTQILLTYLFIGIIYEIFLIFDTEASLGFISPTDHSKMINFYINIFSPLGIIVVFYYLSLFGFLGLGFLFKGFNSKGILRRKYFYLALAEIIFIPTSFLELLPVPTIYFFLNRPVLIVLPFLIYLGFREESNLKDISYRIEQKLFLLQHSPIEDFKSSFLRRASHELKTPLIPIKANLDYLLNEYSEPIAKGIKTRLNEILLGYNKLENVIQNFLLSLELDGNGIDLNRKPLNLSELIEKSIGNHQDLINIRNHEIKCKLGDKLIVFADKTRIQHVFDNLLTNSIKFTPSNGIIKIYSKRNPHYIRIFIEDNGIGLTEKEKGYLFQKFGKIERYGRGWDIISQGSGLGLFISKKIINAHGGKIWVHSEGRNKGSIFSFKLPHFKDK
jgi:signal transduction histidine kinase